VACRAGGRRPAKARKAAAAPAPESRTSAAGAAGEGENGFPGENLGGGPWSPFRIALVLQIQIVSHT
jgi:hypothetical protein